MVYLDKIDLPRDIKSLSKDELDVLCGEIRQFLVDNLSRTGGHLASNLGAVELTVALHRVYDTSRDRLVFDVGHQCYIHKILTGRMDGFRDFRELDGMSGFPKPSESVHDAFIAGHASNSVSVALGMARARTAAGGDYDVAAVIGDGALNGGMAFEGLSDAGQSGEPLVIILNDNGMSINQGVGGLADMLSRMRTKPEYINFKRWYRGIVGTGSRLYRFTHEVKRWIKDRVIPDNIFDNFGFEYLGPMDGHDIAKMETALRWAREQKRPCLIHVITKKGQGYLPAENHPAQFHGIGAFDVRSGEPCKVAEDFSTVFGDALLALGREDRRVTAITAAMTEGTGLSQFFRELPGQFYDVGIAEEHACAMAAGMASQGLIPVLAIYSTFLQRSYDMLIHDVSLMGLHVVLAVDRAGIVGKDGQTHQGTFDVSYLSDVPGMTIFAPSSFQELRSMLRRAVMEETGPVAVRYPRGGEGAFAGDTSDVPCAVLREGTDVTILTYGIGINEALAAAEMLAADGVEAEVLKLNRLAPLDISGPAASVKKTGRLLTAEEVCRPGSVGEKLLAAFVREGVAPRAVRCVDLGDGILPNGLPEALRERAGLDGAGLARAAKEMLDAEDEA